MSCHSTTQNLHDIFSGPGEARAACRAVDWSATALGAWERWPQGLRAAVRICLASKAAMAVWAGPELILIHNEHCASVLGDQYLQGMGRPLRALRPERWDQLRPAFEQVLNQGVATPPATPGFFPPRRGLASPSQESLTPIGDEDGRIVGVLSLFHAAPAQRDELYDFALTAAGMGTWERDLADLSVYRSPEHARIFGYEPPLQPWSFETFLAHVVPRDRQRVKKAVREAIAARQNINLECRITRHDGQTRWVWIAARYRVGEDGNPKLAGIVQDVTPRKQAEEALLSSEARFRAFFQNIPDAVLLVVAGDKVLAANPAACAMFGMSEAEIVRGGREALIDPGDPRCDIGFAERNQKGHITNWEQTYIRKSGEKFTGEVTSAILDSKALHAFVVIRDITGRKQVEQALQESKTKLEAALESLDDAVFITDQSGNLVDFNQAFAEFHQFATKDECRENLDRYSEIFQAYDAAGKLVPPESWPIARALRGETVTKEEYLIRKKDTGETWRHSLNFAPIRDARGTIIGTVVVGRDITERKRGKKQA